MATSTTTEFEGMGQFASQTGNAAQSLQTLFHNLTTSQLQPIADFSKGAGAMALQSAIQTVQTESAKMVQALNTISQKVSTAGNTYAVSDEQQGSELNTFVGNTTGITSALTIT